MCQPQSNESRNPFTTLGGDTPEESISFKNAKAPAGSTKEREAPRLGAHHEDDPDQQHNGQQTTKNDKINAKESRVESKARETSGHPPTNDIHRRLLSAH